MNDEQLDKILKKALTLHCSTDIFCGAAKKDVSGVLGTAK